MFCFDDAYKEIANSYPKLPQEVWKDASVKAAVSTLARICYMQQHEPEALPPPEFIDRLFPASKTLDYEDALYGLSESIYYSVPDRYTDDQLMTHIDRIEETIRQRLLSEALKEKYTPTVAQALNDLNATQQQQPPHKTSRHKLDLDAAFAVIRRHCTEVPQTLLAAPLVMTAVKKLIYAHANLDQPNGRAKFNSAHRRLSDVLNTYLPKGQNERTEDTEHRAGDFANAILDSINEHQIDFLVTKERIKKPKPQRTAIEPHQDLFERLGFTRIEQSKNRDPRIFSNYVLQLKDEDKNQQGQSR